MKRLIHAKKKHYCITRNALNAKQVHHRVLHKLESDDIGYRHKIKYVHVILLKYGVFIYSYFRKFDEYLLSFVHTTSFNCPR